MSRLPLSLVVLVLAAGLLAAQPKKDAPPPKEPVYDGKTLAEWVKQLGSEAPGERARAVKAVAALAGQSDEVAEKLVSLLPQSGAMEAVVRLGPVAVPALTRGLWVNETRPVCLQLIGLFGDDARSAGPALTRLLADPAASPGTRREAAAALGFVGWHPALPALAKSLESPEEQLAVTAAAQIVRLGGGAEVVLLVLTEALKRNDPAAQRIAADELVRLGPEAAPVVPALIGQLPGADLPLTLKLIAALGRIGPAAKEAVPVLKKKLADAKDEHRDVVRVAVALALWQIARDPDAAKLLREQLARDRRPGLVVDLLWRIDRGPDAVTALEGMLKSEKPDEVIAAAGVLGAQSKDTVPLLGKFLAHKEPSVRAQAVVALARLGPGAKPAAEALRAATKDDAPLIAFWAAVTVCRIDPTADAEAAVAAYLSDRDPALRQQAAEALGLLGSAAKPAGNLTATLTDADDFVKLAAAGALWRRTSNPVAIATAVEVLRSPDSRAREQAAVEIGGTFGAEAKSAVPALTRRLFDTHSAVRSATAEALGRIGPGAKDAVPALLAVLDGDEPAFVQSATCEALGLVGPADKDAVAAVLKKKLEHPDPLVRVHAALALWHVAADKAGEKEAERGLGYRTYQVRITAAEAAWRMNQDARAVPLLVRALEESNLDGTGSDNERYMACRALGRIGAAAKPAVPELAKLVNHHDPALAATAAEALRLIDPEATKKAGVK